MKSDKSLNQIRALFEAISTISDADWNFFKDHLQYDEYNKGDLLTSIGEIENYMYFVVKGIVRTFYYNSIQEYTLDFRLPVSPIVS